jgi:putative transposase
MARGKKHTPEQVVNLLRQIEVAVANGNHLTQREDEDALTRAS